MNTMAKVLTVNLLLMSITFTGLAQGKVAVNGARPARADAAGILTGTVFNVKSYGAKGDGKALDSPAINKAIDAAAAAGGGTVFLPSGSYRSFSIRLKSNISLYFDQGSVL